jgi:hypothetical protein
MAFDILSIPAMSAECERAFSQARRTITANRCCLKEAAVNALECLKQWQMMGIIKPPAGLNTVAEKGGVDDPHDISK